MTTSRAAPALVVICYYDGFPVAPLVRLLRQMARIPAGAAFEVLVVVNSVTGTPPALPEDLQDTPVLLRENRGYNLAAWNAGWAAAPDHDLYLFLQSECEIRRPGWLAAFNRATRDSRTGLVGESLFRFRNWQAIDARWGDGAHRSFEALCRANGMPDTGAPTHLQSIIVAARRDVLAATGGFASGDDKVAAYAAEIFSSVRARHQGYRLRQVAWYPYSFISHPQWDDYRRATRSIGWTTKRLVRSAGALLGTS